MIRKIYNANDLFNDSVDLDMPIYLDSTSWEQFKKWVAANEVEFSKILERNITFRIFEVEFAETEQRIFQEIRRFRRVATRNTEDETQDIPLEKMFEDQLGIQFVNDRIRPNPLGLAEVELVYFHDETNPTLKATHAKFVMLTRQAARNATNIRVMSAYPSFQRLANAEVFILPNLHPVELPANFDVFTELELHPRLRQAISGHFYAKNYPSTVFEAAKELYQYLREASGLSTDGGTLADQALRIETTRTTPKTITAPPTLKVNHLASDSEIEEQEGYWRLFLGVAKAMRNSNAHTPATDPFISSRFNNQKTTIKVLCFLSMLFEKIDQRVP